jgi:hypothetical protein
VTDLERLLDSSPSPAARRLLRVGLRDAPPPGSLVRTAAALGLGASALVVAAPAAASASVSAGAVAGGVAAASTKASVATGLSLAALSKWLVVGAVSGVLVSGTVAAVRRASAPVPARTLAPAAAVVHQAPAGQRLAPTPTREPSVEAVGEPVASASSLPTPLLAAPPVPGASGIAPGGTLGAEAARVDAARRALARGDLDQALVELDAYQRTRSLGVLDREALILRIQVLVAQGQAERALVLARSYLRSRPADAYSERLEGLIANGGRAWPAAGGIDRSRPGH